MLQGSWIASPVGSQALGFLSLSEITLVKCYLDFFSPFVVHLIIMEESTRIYLTPAPPPKQMSLVSLPLTDKLFQPQIAKLEKPRAGVPNLQAAD